MNEWSVRLAARTLKPGDRFVFARDLGGDGEILTVESVINNLGVLTVYVEEFDAGVLIFPSTFVTVEP